MCWDETCSSLLLYCIITINYGVQNFPIITPKVSVVLFSRLFSGSITTAVRLKFLCANEDNVVEIKVYINELRVIEKKDFYRFHL